MCILPLLYKDVHTEGAVVGCVCHMAAPKSRASLGQDCDENHNRQAAVAQEKPRLGAERLQMWLGHQRMPDPRLALCAPGRGLYR